MKCPLTCNTCPQFQCKDLKPWCENGDCKSRLVVSQCPKKCGIVSCDYGYCPWVYRFVRGKAVYRWQSKPVEPTQSPRKCTSDDGADDGGAAEDDGAKGGGDEGGDDCTTQLNDENISKFREYFNDKKNNITTAKDGGDETIKCLVKVYECLATLDFLRY